VISTVPGEDKAHRLPEEHEPLCVDSHANGPTHCAVHVFLRSAPARSVIFSV
jgi:hypothetical protein